MKNKNIISLIFSALLSAVFVAVAAYAATTISTDINTGGTLTVSGNSTIAGQLTVSGTATSTIAGDVNFNSGTLYIDSINNRIGIGTTSPYAMLSVTGQVVANYFTATSTTATSTFPYLAVSTNSNLGTVVGGTWQGTAIADTYISSASSWNNKWDLASTTIGTIYGGTGTSTAPTYGKILVGTSGGVYQLQATSTLGITQDLSGYVPYTGATADVDLGGNTLILRQGAIGFYDGVGNLRGWIDMEEGADKLTISNSDGSGNTRAILDLSLLVVDDRTFTFPDVSGTLALLENSQTFTGTKTFNNATYSALFTGGNIGIGTSTPSSILTVSSGASATTTIEFGDQYSTNSKTCFNVKNNTGANTSFYFVGTAMVVEAGRCK